MTEDKIGRTEIVDKICSLVDNLQKDKHFCLALNGDWGSGKTFVMQMIEEKLKTHAEYVVIKYDAWENNFYSDPLISILSCVIDGIENKLYLVEQKKEKLLKSAKTAVNTVSKISSKIDKLKNIINGIKDIVKTFHNPINLELVGDFKSYQSLLKETKAILNEITTQQEYRDKQNKLIILVDEIDRCLPDEQLKILERLHHLFDVKNCAVICAINKGCIAKNVNTTYGIDGNEYLRKFFDFNYKLETNANVYLENLLKDLYKTLKSVHQNATEEPIRTAYQCLLYGSKNVLEQIDNRELDRYFDAINRICNDFNWQEMTKYYLFFIIIALYIRKNISTVFLDESDIIENQKKIQLFDSQQDETEYYNRRNKMPYFDYLKEYLGIDREHLHIDIVPVQTFKITNIPEYSFYFNEIVCYSLGGNFNGNEMRAFYHQPTVNIENCQKLRELVIKYGGEKD